jgi:hypothetical protein
MLELRILKINKSKLKILIVARKGAIHYYFLAIEIE